METKNISNLIAQVNALLLKNEPENISYDTYGGYSGYKPQFIIDAMNETFGIGQWGFREISSEIEGADKGALIVAQVEVWLSGVDFKPTGYGQGRVTKGDLGDARKSAQTDAIKKAFSYFSIGNRAYRGELPEKDQVRSNNQNMRGNQQSHANTAQRSTAQSNKSDGQASNSANQTPSIKRLKEDIMTLGYTFDSVIIACFRGIVGDNKQAQAKLIDAWNKGNVTEQRVKELGAYVETLEPVAA